MRNETIRSGVSSAGLPVVTLSFVGPVASVLCLFGFVLMVALAGGAVRAYASGCSNEVLRAESSSTQLPECRAYELVSPVAKNGWPVQTVSADSSHVLISTLGSFAGGNQRGVINLFDVERTFDGWMTSPFVVPTSLVNTAFFNLLAASADLSTGLFTYRLASGLSTDERNFYVQQLPGGSPVEVGPAFSEAALKSGPVVGNGREVSRPASMSNGHVLFAIGGRSQLVPGVNDLWPGDSTAAAGNQLGFGSLYEYAGTENKAPPKLVGVRNSGPLKSNEEAQLISQCGTSLGFPRRGVFNLPNFPVGETYNAIPGSGSFSRVFFTAAAANSGPSGNACNASGEGSGPPVDELYVRVDASETVALSEPSLSIPGRLCSETCREDEKLENGHVRSAGFFQGASEDGSKVFFLTDQPLVDGDKDGARDLYMAEIGDVQGHQGVTRLIQVSHDPNSGEAAEVQGVARVSSKDGSHVYFVARGVLTTKANSVGNAAQPGADNLYVYDTETGHLAFIGDLCSGAETSGAIAESKCPANLNSELPGNNSLNDLEVWRQEDRRPFDVTPDGRFAVFTSYADLTPGDTSTVQQVFEYNAETEQLVRVSVGENGFNKDGNTTTTANGAGIAAPSYDESQNPAPQLTSVSDDGSTVVFQSSDALTSQAVEGYPNVYEYRGGQVYLISDGQDRALGFGGTTTTSLVGMDGSGRDIFFTSADRLVPLDGDTQEDVYDARVEGGFPPPATRPMCEGDGCQGTIIPSPSFPMGGSASQLSGEDIETSPTLYAAKTKVKPRKTARCSRGKKLSHGRCVKAKRGSKRGARARKSDGGRGARR
jgi:hypothetical protein